MPSELIDLITKRELQEDAEANAEAFGWLCVSILGMVFPAQFEAIVSRCYMDMSISRQAWWMSCSRRNVAYLMKRGRRNLRIIRRYLEAHCVH